MMNMHIALLVTLLSVVAMAETMEAPTRTGPSLLALPRPGIPISLEQVEQFSIGQDNSVSKADIVRSKTYRDSVGRLRIESNVSNTSGDSVNSWIDLIDPQAGTRILLFSTEKIAYRLPYPKNSIDNKLAVMGFGDVRELSHKWSLSTKDIEKQKIEGFEFEGTRVTQTAEDQPGLTREVEQWYSEELKLIGEVIVSGPYGTHTIHIKNLHREEPDPKLFAIPQNYTIHDVQLPTS